MRALHTFEPVFDDSSRILILGSFPSVRSRAEGFYYGHPRNRFWQIMARLYGSEPLVTTDEKRDFLLKHRIALWDVCHSCEIDGSSDSSIREVIANDLSRILAVSQIERIFTNGSTADKLYVKHQLKAVGIASIPLPSTSPANAAWSIDRLCQAWSAILTAGI